MWVIPEDGFRVSNAADLARVICETFHCETWLVNANRGLAFSFKELLTNRGVPLDYNRFLDIAVPLLRFLEPFLVLQHDALDLDIPGSRYWTRVLLSPGEADKKSCMYIKSSLSTLEKVKLRIYSTRPLTPQGATRIERFLLKWMHEARNESVNGERLLFTVEKMERYQVARSATSYGEDGFEISVSDWRPTTWPWIEFYLLVRQTFPQSERLSVRFVEN